VRREGTATVPTPIGFDREIVGELAVAEEREWRVGTWRIGRFVDAHLRVHGDAVAARRFLDPFGDHLRQPTPSGSPASSKEAVSA
jgi:hypothetical protein